MAGVWAILQHREGKAHSGSWEAVTAAKRIAQAVGETAHAVLLGSDVKTLADEAARTGVASVRVADHPALANYVPGPYTAALVGAALTRGNQYTVLTNGDQIFPAQLAAIRAAKERISFETYVYKDGQVAEDFTRALEEAARRGETL